MRKIIFTFLHLYIFTFFAFGEASAQEPLAPKWVGKVQKKSIVEVYTYDKDKQLKSQGTGFFVTADGVCVADYGLFKDAYSAVVTDVKGNKYDVEKILGADETYSLVKFQVAGMKKSVPLEMGQLVPFAGSENGSKVYAVVFSARPSVTCPQTSVAAVSELGGGNVYLTLADSIAEKYYGAPLFDEAAKLVGMVQPSIDRQGYAIGAKYIDTLKIEAIASKMNSLALGNIHIRKGIPDNMDEALVYLYFKSRTADNDEYMAMLNEFVATYPQNAEGYLRRSTPLIDLQRFDEAENDLQKYLSLATDKGKAYASVADVIYTKLVYQPTPEYDRWTYQVAVDYVDKAMAVDSAKLDYKLLKGRILTAAKRYDEAIALYDDINNSKDRSAATYYAACLVHDQNGDTATVQIEQLDSAIALFGTPLPKEASTYVMHRAKLYERIGEYRKAVMDYNTYCYLVNNKVNDQFYFDRAVVELRARMYQQCLDDLNKAIELNPNEPSYKETKKNLEEALGI